MSLSISTKKIVPGIVVIEPSDNLVTSSSIGNLRDEVIRIVGEGYRKVAINLSKVRFMDSTGLGELVFSVTRILNAGGQIVGFGSDPKLVSLFRITKLDTVFKTVATEDDAIKALSQPKIA